MQVADMSNKESFKFLDLCAGIGGFHQAMRRLGGICVGASEIDAACIGTYKKNFPETPMLGDLNKIADGTEIGDFQVLCAGFPCQPFSKAGKRLGFEDETRGKLFFKIMQILESHPEVEFLILENVRNLADQKEYWETIQQQLHALDFVITEDPLILSPSDFAIPQVRERVFILGIRRAVLDARKLRSKNITKESLRLRLNACSPTQALSILDEKVDNRYYVDEERQEMLLAWDEFREGTGIKVIGFPIWLNAMGLGHSDTDLFFQSVDYEQMPGWKKGFYRKNRAFYLKNKAFIDDWVKRHKMDKRIKLYQKFEWNCGEDVPDIKHGLSQVRQSGVRVKRPNYFPALVAINNTPIVWEESASKFRTITPREAARLQSFSEDFEFCGTDAQQYRQLGNAINVEIAYQLGQGLFRLKRGHRND